MDLLKPADGSNAGPLDPMAEWTFAYFHSSKASRTLAAYRADWRAFTTWCEAHGLVALPASPDTVARYLTARAQAGRKVATLAQELAAISQAHVRTGYPSPRGMPPVQEAMKGIRQTVGTAQTQKAPLLGAELRRVLEGLHGNIGARDRALLLVGFFGAFRRSELVGLRMEHVEFSNQGLTVFLRRSKANDQNGECRKVAIPYATDGLVCPVRALKTWLAVADIRAGPIFRRVTRHGRVGGRALTGRAVALIVKRATSEACLDESRYSGHSLRAGLAATAARKGKSEAAIMRQTRHRTAAMVRRYIRDADMWRDNAAAGLLD